MDYGKRNDGTPKGRGYLGQVRNARGEVMTELTVGVNMDGKETEIPTLVPTLTAEEVTYLKMLDLDKGERIPDQILEKAVQFAEGRRAQGLPVFADEYDEELIPHYRKGAGLSPDEDDDVEDDLWR